MRSLCGAVECAVPRHPANVMPRGAVAGEFVPVAPLCLPLHPFTADPAGAYKEPLRPRASRGPLSFGKFFNVWT
jgi:hypothetical protein